MANLFKTSLYYLNVGNINYQTINIILVATLVAITGYYAFQTYKLVKENQKGRHIQQLENGLSYVYSPLLKLFEDAKDERIQVGGKTDKKEMISISEAKFEEIGNIYKHYRYLMSDKLADKISKFTKRISYDYQYREYDIDEIEELYSIVSDEYNVILKSLNKLAERY